jgi:hypothetical protein
MSFEWEIPVIVGVIIAAALYLSGRTRPEPDRSPPDPSQPGPESGHELIERLQRTLGMAILVDSVEGGESVEAAASDEPVRTGQPVTIRATFIFGRYTAHGSVTGESEAEAWDALGRAAIAWRNTDYQHITMWPGGG